MKICASLVQASTMHGGIAYQHACHNIHTYFEFEYIDMMMMAEFFLLSLVRSMAALLRSMAAREIETKKQKWEKNEVNGERNRSVLLSKFVWLHHCLDPDSVITHISRYLHCWCLLIVVTTVHTHTTHPYPFSVCGYCHHLPTYKR